MENILTLQRQRLFDELICCDESNYLDFKETLYHPKASKDKLKDILSLANSNARGNRYIVFGVKDKTKELIDLGDISVEEAHFTNFLSHQGLNRIPDVSFFCVEKQSKNFAVLEIADKPEKPYFVSKGELLENEIWTRHKSGNSRANDQDMEAMWRERFGLNLTPFDRFVSLLKQCENWGRIEEPLCDNQIDELFYYKYDPLFTLRPIGSTLYNHSEKWFPPSHSSQYNLITYGLFYGATRLKNAHLVWCRDAKLLFPLPKEIIQVNENSFPVSKKYTINKKSLNYTIAKLIETMTYPDNSNRLFSIDSYIDNCPDLFIENNK